MPTVRFVETLPFIVRPANPKELQAALELRAQAYARHPRHYPPAFQDAVRQLPSNEEHSTSLIALNKEDGRLIGTLRMRSSLRTNVVLPEHMPRREFEGEPYLYTDRFAVDPGPLADIVMLALVKGQWFHAYHERVRWIVGVCMPPLGRRYIRVGLRILRTASGSQVFPIDFVDNKDSVAVGEALEHMPGNILVPPTAVTRFMLDTDHPDILVPRPVLVDEHIAQARARASEPAPAAT